MRGANLMTSQHVMVILLVGAAVALVIRRLVLTARGKGGCGCCNMKGRCDSDGQDGGNPSKETADSGTRNK